MRQFFTVALSALLLTGCGAQGIVATAYQPTSSRLMAKTAAPFVQVLNHEDAVQETVNKAFTAWAQPQRLSFPMEPGNQVREVQGIHAGASAIRALPGGSREVIGWAVFSAGKPSSFIHFQASRVFRMVLKPDGTVREARLEGDKLDTSAVVKPAYEAVDAAQAKALKAQLDTFLHEPAQASWLKTFLWAAIAGDPTPPHTYELHAVRATRGNFGAFGRVLRFRGTLLRDGKPFPGYTNFEIEVVMDRSGKVIAAGDPTSW